MLLRLVAVILLLVTASPGAFWLLYGTLDPCDALVARGLALKSGPRPADPLAAAIADLAGPAVLRAMLTDAGLQPADCLDLLWKLEREPGGRLATASGP